MLDVSGTYQDALANAVELVADGPIYIYRYERNWLTWRYGKARRVWSGD